MKAKTKSFRKLAKRSIRLWSGFFVVVASVLLYSLIAPQLRQSLGLIGNSEVPQKTQSLRLVTWNLHNFPNAQQNLERIQSTILGLNADLIAVQEVVNKDALAQLFPTWQLYLSQAGGRGHQKLGVLVNPETIEVIGLPQEHPELSFSGDLRPAYSLYVRARHLPLDFHVVVVHLKARSVGFEIRQTQWNALNHILAQLPQQSPGQGDQDIILLGDFNMTGPENESADVELEELQAILGAQNLVPIENPAGCSVYWDGQRRDAWKEPSLLDMIWVTGLPRESLSTAQALTHCDHYRCQPFRSTKAYPELDYEAMSDHCPVMLDIYTNSSALVQK